jgi:hypothetical protein
MRKDNTKMNAANIILSTAIAVAGIVIAFSQLTIAQANFRHVAFERRYAVYSAAKKLIASVVRQANISQDEIFTFFRDTADSVFILDDTVTAYLTQIRAKAFRLTFLRQIVESSTPPEQVNSAIKESMQIVTWFTE